MKKFIKRTTILLFALSASSAALAQPKAETCYGYQIGDFCLQYPQ
ncbi:hypothetical protein [Alteromonas ponticola]|nr:hypothetical protein [Alteromonas ponticola]